MGRPGGREAIGIDLHDHVIVGTMEDGPLRIGCYWFRSAGLH